VVVVVGIDVGDETIDGVALAAGTGEVQLDAVRKRTSAINETFSWQ
jgi:hypothetical protein